MLDGQLALKRLTICLCDDAEVWPILHRRQKSRSCVERLSSIFACQHNCQHAVRHRWISGIGRMRLQIERVIIELEEKPLAINGQRPKPISRRLPLIERRKIHLPASLLRFTSQRPWPSGCFPGPRFFARSCPRALCSISPPFEGQLWPTLQPTPVSKKVCYSMFNYG